MRCIKAVHLSFNTESGVPLRENEGLSDSAYAQGEDRNSNLAVTSQPALPPELMPPLVLVGLPAQRFWGRSSDVQSVSRVE